MPQDGPNTLQLLTPVKFMQGAFGNLLQDTAVVLLKLDGDMDTRHLVMKLPYAPKNEAFNKLSFPCEIIYFIHALQQILTLGQQPAFGDISVQSSAKGIFQIHFPYSNSTASNQVVAWLINIINAGVTNTYKSEKQELLVKQHNQALLSLKATAPNALSLMFLKAAEKQGKPWRYLGSNFAQIGWGKSSRIFEGSFTSGTSSVGTRMVLSKAVTKKILFQNAFPVAEGGLFSDISQATKYAAQKGYPTVIKPMDTDGGSGVTVDVRTTEEFTEAFTLAQKLSHSSNVIVEKYIPGNDHRLLVIEGKLIAASKKLSAGIIGNGKHTVQELVHRTNKDPRRGNNKQSLLISLKLDKEAARYLKRQNLSPDSIPDEGQFVYLRKTCNISTGGTAVNVLDIIHPDNRVLAERAARLFRLDIAGIDLITKDISRSWQETQTVICEVNAQPGFRPHWIAEPSRDLGSEILERLFKGRDGRIPLFSVTGSNGKTTVSMMIANIMQQSGLTTGVATTAGTFINNKMIGADNLSGCPGGQVLLADPSVEAVVIEMPRKGLISLGRPFDRSDIAVMTNVQNDHIGIDGINTIEEMAELKGQLLAFANRAVVINGDDPLCLEQCKRVQPGTEILLVCEQPETPEFTKHLANGGRGISLQKVNDEIGIALYTKDYSELLIFVNEIPATMDGIAHFNIQNSMFAIGACLAQGVAPTQIISAMVNFHSNTETNPGRLNFISGFPCRVLLDYAHNPDGIKAVCQIVEKIPVKGRRIVVCINVGNRHSEHIKSVSPDLQKSFDSFICSKSIYYLQNPEYQNLPEEHVPTLIADQLSSKGVSKDNIYIEPELNHAVAKGIAISNKDDLVVILGDTHEALSALDKVKNQA